MKPVTATVKFSDGTLRPVNAWDVEDLFDAAESLVRRRKSAKLSAADEGHEIAAKTIREVGGRTEFERSVQRQIIAGLKAAERPGLRRVLLIGDSIRMRQISGAGYGRHAYRQLIGKVNLSHIPHNCGSSTAVLENLTDWLSCKPDLVHINAGLHDLAIDPKAKIQRGGHATVERYAENLTQIFQMLADRSIATIWAPNTPVDDELHAIGSRSLHRKNADVLVYNDAARRVAAEFAIPINDIYTPLVEAGVRDVLVDDGVHLSHRGSAIAGELVAKAILDRLEISD